MMFERLCERFEDLVARGRIPGAVLWVDQGDRALLRRAIGWLGPEHDVPMALDAIFRIYSMSKPITSVAALMLCEEGRLHLDEPLKTYLPEFVEQKLGIIEPDEAGIVRLSLRPARREATVRDLLRHTAGLTYGYFETSLVKDEYLKSGVESRTLNNQEMAERLARLPLAFEPGTTWEYSRATDLLGALIERLSGQSLGAFLAERIFAPLGMVDTGFSVAPGQHARLAEPLRLDPDTGEPVRVIDVLSAPRFESGGGGLVSTAPDYARFQALLRGKGALGAIRLLSEATVEEMTRDHLGTIDRGPAYLPRPDYGFGLGVAVRMRETGTGGRGEYYWGGLAGTFQWIDPVHELGAILMLQAPNQRDELRTLFYEGVYAALHGAA